MNAGRIWMVIGGLVGVAIIAFGYFVAASPLLTQAALADTQRADVESTNSMHEQTLASMKELDARKDELLERIDELSTSVPVVPSVEDYLDELTRFANDSLVSLSSIRVDSPTLFTPPAEAGPTVFSPGLQQRLYMLPVQIEFGGDATQVSAFVNRLQTDGRLQLVKKLEMRLGSTLTASITGVMFVLHDPAIGALTSAPVVVETPAEPESSTEEGAEDGEEGVEPQPGATPTPPAED